MVQFNVPNCFSADCDCEGSPPGCIPSQCDGPKCCCCTSVDIISDIRARCYNRVFFSCNIDGTSSGPGEDPFPSGCSQCFDACDRALGGTEACTSISQNVDGFDPSPPDWWTFPPIFGPCECNCAEFVDPNNPSAGCNLTCVTCDGMQCNANVEVLASSCNYSFNLTPSTGCCGTPALVDTVFVIDYSGSMGSIIDNVISDVGDIADQLLITGGQARFGLIVYGKTTNDVTVNTFSNGEILTSDIDDFKAKLSDNLPISGGAEPDFDAVEKALITYPWGGVENLIFLIGDESVDGGEDGIFPIAGDLGNPLGQPSAALLIELANSLDVTVNVVQPQPPHERYDSRKTDLALGTNGANIDILLSFSTIVDDLNLVVFGASCDCLDFTPIPVKLCTGGTGIDGDECIGETTDIPIKKCLNDNLSDCSCNEPLSFDICGEIVTITPDPETLNLVCCGEIEGGCICSSETTCPEGCCGVECSGIDICSDFNNVEDAIEAIWCLCYHGDDVIVVTSECTRCTIPDPEDEDYKDFNIGALTNCEIKLCNGQGGFFSKTRPEIDAEVRAAWADCQGADEEPPPPSISEASCLPECDRPDECIVGELKCQITEDQDTEDIRDCRAAACSDPEKGCSSTRNPATVILNNGIGLVAYESMLNNTVIKIDQFNTSLPAKILPNRRTNYGRLENAIRWADGPSGITKLVKLYYFSAIPSHFMNGILGVPTPGVVSDMVVFQNGPFQNQCFSLYTTTTDDPPIGEDDIGNFIRFTVPNDFVLSNPFPSLDDVYDIEWFIVDSDDTGLTGSALENDDTPGADFLLTANTVNTTLQLTPHIHDGAPVPVAYPSLAVAHNYMNAVENSHFVYLVYQALEDRKWNLYMRQLRLSEYSREGITDAATYISLTELGITELVYRVICTTDNCSPFGTSFLAKRTVSMEIVLQDGRDVFNLDKLSNAESWNICPGAAAGSFPKKRVFAELTHSAIVNKCPDQFEFNDLFFNWDSGDEFAIPFITLTADSLFILLSKPNDSSLEITEDLQTVSGITTSSSRVEAVWFDDPTLDTWTTINSAGLQTALSFKGLDVSGPVPITEFETGHCTHPVVKVNSNNDVFVVYECTDPLLHQIHITGTATPSTSLPLGIFEPKNIDATLDYFFAPDDFKYRETVTESSDGINQLPDMYVDANDKIHIVWQSNRDNYWEIYYANSEVSFVSKRITDFKSKSLKPSIDGDIRGNLHIAWHDDRFGNWEILMAYRDDERVETLFEQDPYLAGIRNEGYNHSSDLIPLVLKNTSNTNILCITTLIVRFFTDRLLSQAAFDVAQSDFPIAFKIPGSEYGTRSTSIVPPAFDAWTFFGSLLVGGVSRELYIADSPTAVGSSAILKSFSITFDSGFAPTLIAFGGGPTADIADNIALDSEGNPSILGGSGTGSMDISGIESGVDVLLSSLSHVGVSFDVGEVFGSFIKVKIAADTGGLNYLSDLLEIKLNMEQPGQACLVPGETVTGFLDVTPSIRNDKLGNEVIETPLPIAARKNKVYFISVLGINSTGDLVVFEDQKRTMSCESCSEMDASWDFSSCSFKIVLSNFNNPPVGEIRFFNVRVRFYTDLDKLNLIAQFDAFADADGQLECFTIDDNVSAESVWKTEGLEIFFGQQRIVNLWPMLSNTAGLLCGVQYWVETEICSGSESDPCGRLDLAPEPLVGWTCECSSPRWSERFGSGPVNIRDLIRWRSSGDGFSDTRLTETGLVNNFNPQIRIRSDLTGLVLYESNRDNPPESEIHTVYASAFSIFPLQNMYATGAQAITSSASELLVHSDIPITACNGTDCDDTGPAMEGRNLAFSLDQYGNVFLATEKQHDQSKCEEFTENNQQSITVHRCGAQAKNLNFTPEEQGGVGVVACSSEEILGKTAPLVTDKTFKKIIKLARVNNKFASYHITRSKRPAAVVEQCQIAIDIITEPDAIAVRLRNEDRAWSNWYPFDPDKGEYTISVPWLLSPISGLKTVTIEAATYQGLSAVTVVTVVADYKGIDHSVKFYRSKVITAPIPGFSEISDAALIGVLTAAQSSEVVFVEANILPQLEGLPVAGIRQPTVQGSVIVKKFGEFIYIELIPSLDYLKTINPVDGTTDDAPTFDVLQQGDEDLFSLPTLFNSAKNLFQGVFPVREDNMTFFQDGLSFVIPHFKNDCSDLNVEIFTGSQYIRDKFNQPIPGGIPAPGTETSTADVWAGERDKLGRVKHSFDIRGSEDPYFVFGDPNYRLKKQHE